MCWRMGAAGRSPIRQDLSPTSDGHELSVRRWRTSDPSSRPQEITMNPSLPEFGSSDPQYDRFVDIYVDESSQTGHRYLLFGALMVPTASVEGFVQLVSRARLPELPKGEMGW